jgi:hypothetical protein
MGFIRKWRTRTRRERITAAHNAHPLMQTLERHVEAGARKIEIQKVSGKHEWEVAAIYYEEAK